MTKCESDAGHISFLESQPTLKSIENHIIIIPVKIGHCYENSILQSCLSLSKINNTILDYGFSLGRDIILI